MDWFWPLNQRWFWELFFIFLLLFILPFVVIGCMLYFAAGYVFLFLILALIILFVYRSYVEWAGKKEDAAP